MKSDVLLLVRVAAKIICDSLLLEIIITRDKIVYVVTYHNNIVKYNYFLYNVIMNIITRHNFSALW